MEQAEITNPKKKSAKKSKAPIQINFSDPVIVEKKYKKATAADIVEVTDSNFMVAIDLKRQRESEVHATDIEDGQRLFPYAILPRLLVGFQSVSFVSSLSLELTPDHPLPRVTVRFLEKLSQEDAKTIDPSVRAQIMANIALVQQYPFVTVESPLLSS